MNALSGKGLEAVVADRTSETPLSPRSAPQKRGVGLAHPTFKVLYSNGKFTLEVEAYKFTLPVDRDEINVLYLLKEGMPNSTYKPSNGDFVNVDSPHDYFGPRTEVGRAYWTLKNAKIQREQAMGSREA